MAHQQQELPLIPLPDIIQRRLLPLEVIRILLARRPVGAQTVQLAEPVLEDVAAGAPVVGDPRLGAALVARVQRPALAQVLLDGGAEGRRQDGAVGNVGGLQAADQGAGVDGLREGRAVAGEEGGVEEGEVAGLLLAFGGEVRVEPVLDAVAVEERPVVLGVTVSVRLSISL